MIATNPDHIDHIIDDLRKSALLNAARRKADALINALHELDGSRRGGGFNSANLGRARDCVEMTVAGLEW